MFMPTASKPMGTKVIHTAISAAILAREAS